MLGVACTLGENGLCYAPVTRTRRRPRMRVKLQRVLWNEEGDEETVTDGITRNKNTQRIEPLGLPLSEATQLLSTPQRHLLRQPVDALLNTYADCPDCGTPLHLKARSRRSLRTVFGTFQFDSPRLEHCDCTRHKTASFRLSSAIILSSRSRQLSGKSTYVSQGLRELSPAAHLSPFSQLLPAISSNTVKMLIGWPGVT